MQLKLAILSVFTCFFSVSFLAAQTVISSNIEFGNTLQSHSLYTTNGDQFIGRAVYIQNDTIGFKIRNLTGITPFVLNEVAFLGLTEEAFSRVAGTYSISGSNSLADEYPMPLNQLIYSSTAIPYESNGTFRNTLILVNQVDFRISKHFSAGGAAFIPALIMGRVQGQISATEMIHLGLALQYYVMLFDELTATHPYVMLTVGTRERYLNFTTGYWIDRFDYGRPSTDTYPMVTLGGSFAFARDWRFFIEAAAVFQTYNNLVLPSFNFSHHRKKSMLEFGLLAIPDVSFPLLPILSYHRIF